MTQRSTSIVHILILPVLLLAVQSETNGQPSTNPPAQREVKVLGIGNSFTGNAFRYLEPMGKSSEKCRLTLGRAIIGGTDQPEQAKTLYAKYIGT